MALVDDVEFYGRAVDAGEMDHATAVRLLVAVAEGSYTDVDAAHAIDNWSEFRGRLERLMFEVHEDIRIIQNGGDVTSRALGGIRRSARRRAWDVIRRADNWEEQADNA